MAYFHTTVLDNQIKALPTVDTASGSVATFDTDMTENLLECVCDIDNSASEIIVGYDKNYDYFVDFNQLAKEVNSTNYEISNINYGSVSFADGVATITAVNNFARIRMTSGAVPTFNANNVYLIECSCKTNYSHSFYPLLYNVGGLSGNVLESSPTNSWTKYYKFLKLTSNDYSYIYFGDVSTFYSSGDITEVKDIQIFDLNQIFSDTVANEIYNMETQTVGSGLAYFEDIFTNEYYAYTVSTIETIGTANNDGTGGTFHISFGETVSSGATYDAVSGLLTRSDTTTKKVDNCIIPTNTDINHILCNTGDISVKYLLSVGKKIS